MQGRQVWHSFIAIVAAVVLGACGDNLTPDDGNGPPVVEALSLTTLEDTPVSQPIPATDPDGDPLTFTLSPPMHGSVTEDGTQLTYTSAPNYAGTDTFTVTVSDGVASATATVTITVTPVNDIPVAVDDAFATPEDTALSLAPAQLLSNDTDVDGDPLTVVAVAAGTGGTVAMSGGSVVFTPTLDFVGTATFSYTASDGTASDTATVTVTIGGQNDPPVAANDSASTAEDTAVVIPAATLLSNDSDPDGQTVSVVAASNATNGTVSLTGTDLTFTPSANFSGTATFEYTVSDGALTDVGLVTVAVTPVNDAPVAGDDMASTPEDTALVIAASDLLLDDTDVDGDTLVVSMVGNAQNGTVSLTGTDIVFTPATDFDGTATFEYTISDGAGGTDVGLVTITVGAVNDPPLAVDDTAQTDEDIAVMISAATLLANDTDSDSANLTITAVGSASNGSVSLSAATITFTPSPNFSGSASFQYTVSDGDGGTDVATVTLTVDPINDPPVAVNDTVMLPSATSSSIGTATLLGNDSDPELAALTIVSLGGAVNCSVGLDATSVTFTPAPGFIGLASFTYTVSDGSVTATATVTVDVIGSCGDGIVTSPELCDDDNLDETDGCTTQCVLAAVCDVTTYPGGDRFTVDPATGHCYVAYDDDMDTFADAQAACVADDGHLITITGAVEQALASSIQNPLQNPWIGGADAAVEGAFEWVTGEPFTFTSFVVGQPDDSLGEDCLHLADPLGNWADTSCALSTFVVGRLCEYEPVPCGNAVLQAGESCDDGNTTAGDGCSATCQIEPGATCPGAGPCGKLVINEVDYDQPGTDNTGADFEFVEIYNAGSGPADLSNVALVLINDTSNQEYMFDGTANAASRLLLSSAGVPGNLLPPGGIVVAVPSAYAGAVAPSAHRIELVPAPAGFIQNGAPDAIGLFDLSTNTVVDGLSFEGQVGPATLSGIAGTFGFAEGTGAAADPANDASRSLRRLGPDTQNNATDFVLGVTTPGLPNL